jgi:P27 family predicted phage terminase small subunit
MRGVKPYLAVDNSGTVKEEPPAPDWISGSALEEWRRVVPDLVARGRLNEADLGSVEAYCIAVGQIRDMQRLITEQGAVIYSDKGLPKRHPAVAIQAEATNRARLLANELGLTPVSRQRPSIRDNNRDHDSRSLFDMDF